MVCSCCLSFARIHDMQSVRSLLAADICVLGTFSVSALPVGYANSGPFLMAGQTLANSDLACLFVALVFQRFAISVSATMGSPRTRRSGRGKWTSSRS